MRSLLRSPGLTAGAVAALLWVLSGGVYLAVAGSGTIANLLTVVGVGPVQTATWRWPAGWALVGSVMAIIVLVAVVFAIVDRFAVRGNALLVMWMAVVLACTLLGLCIDLVGEPAVTAGAWPGSWTVSSVNDAAAAALWAVLFGWLPALVGARVFRTSGLSPYSASRPRRRTFFIAAASAAALVAIGGLGALTSQQLTYSASPVPSEQNGTSPDAGLPIETVPTMSPGVDIPSLDQSWCTPDKAMLLLGTVDAATGHRLQTITLMNFSDEACLIEGYPDIAFADQDGRVLDVTVATGSSFLATDPGAAPVMIPAQGQARAMIGWDANSTVGALVARQLHAAPVPGLERGSWPVELDIIAGSTVEITAWELDPFAGMQPDQ